MLFKPNLYFPSCYYIVLYYVNIYVLGKTFEDVDLTEKEWVDYDEKNQTSVGVYELEWQFVKVK